MTKKSLEERVAALEYVLGGKTLQQHFDEHAKVIERLINYHFDQFEERLFKKWDAEMSAECAGLEERQGEKREE